MAAAQDHMWKWNREERGRAEEGNQGEDGSWNHCTFDPWIAQIDQPQLWHARAISSCKKVLSALWVEEKGQGKGNIGETGAQGAVNENKSSQSLLFFCYLRVNNRRGPIFPVRKTLDSYFGILQCILCNHHIEKMNDWCWFEQQYIQLPS